MQTWIDIPEHSDFTLQNLPYGIFQTGERTPRAGVAIGEHIIDLHATQQAQLLPRELPMGIFDHATLNPFIAMGKPAWHVLRQKLLALLEAGNPALSVQSDRLLVPMTAATMLLPVHVGDYTDFYSSLEHAVNVGSLFRPDNPLLPNWKHLPVAYHGRSSSIVVSGTDIHRPKGQLMPPDAKSPIFSPSKRMDFELETAFIVGKGTELGETISTKDAESHIFGMVLFNDWSARDIQKWEYQPLGPFLGKNFASSISPWIVTMDALAPFRTAAPPQDPQPLPYLQTTGDTTFDIELEVLIQVGDAAPHRICSSNFKYLYWTMAQQLAHHTVNGCNIQVGDMMGSGTISGKEAQEFGSLLELTQGGKRPLELPDGSQRTFLEDGDTVIMHGFAEKDGMRVGFGEVRSTLLPTK